MKKILVLLAMLAASAAMTVAIACGEDSRADVDGTSSAGYERGSHRRVERRNRRHGRGCPARWPRHSPLELRQASW